MARCMLVAAALLGFASQFVAAQSSSAAASVSAPEIPSWAAADPSGYESAYTLACFTQSCMPLIPRAIDILWVPRMVHTTLSKPPENYLKL